LTAGVRKRPALENSACRARASSRSEAVSAERRDRSFAEGIDDKIGVSS
jgi:hypothetical protein